MNNTFVSWITVAADASLALAYFLVPAALLYFVNRRKDLRFNWIFVLFALFILATGTTHILDIWKTWYPSPEIEAALKLLTALLSIGTSVVLWGLMPRALAIPSFQDLADSEERFKMLVAGVKDYAIFMLDPKGYITTWNAGAERIKGYSAKEVVGKHFSQFYLETDVARKHPQRELEIAAQEGKYEEEGLRVRKNGEVFWANVLITALRDPSGKLSGFSKVTRDITERRKAEDKLLSLNERLEAHVEARTNELRVTNKRLAKLLENAPVGIAVSDDPSCDYIRMNPAFARMLGLEPGENASKNAQRGGNLPFTVLDPETNEELGADQLPMQKAAASGQEVHGVELDVVRSDGKRLNLYEYAIPLFDDGGKVEGCLGIFVDITDRKRAERELADAKEAAEAANRAKSEFLANMSHEIRTPLTAIMGYSQLLREPENRPDEQMTYIDTIERNGRVLGQLIDDILDLSKVEAGRLQLERARVSLPRLLSDLRSTLNVLAEGKGIQLTVRSGPGVPSTLLTDPIRLRQILVNLVGNAIKFTDSGSVQVVVDKVARADGESSLLKFSIIDTGCGLAPEAQGRLFQPFVQADSSATRRFGGTGLGLVLSRRLAQALGGDCVLESSAPGKGSTFATWIDAGPSVLQGAEAAPYVDGAPRTDKTETRLEGLKILVAEDSPDNQALIRRILSRAGAEVEIVCDGQHAVDRALAADHDLVLMDVQMPQLDGYGATSLLRSKGYEKPIIALTAHAMAEEREKSEHAGCNDHLAKPINLRRLIDKICQYAGRGEDLNLN